MSYTHLCRAPLDWKDANIQGLKKVPFEQGLFNTIARSAAFTSRVINPHILFDQLIGSWNIAMPPAGEAQMEARAQVDGKWSPWFNLGIQKGSLFYSPENQKNYFGRVDIDTLKLENKASAFQYRFIFSAHEKPILLRLAAINVSNSDENQSVEPFKPGPWVREIKMRPRSQMEEEKQYSRDVCSPTSLGMVLDYWGFSFKTATIAEAVRDQKTRAFGDWTFNTSFAGSLSILSYVSRFNGLSDIEKEIAADRPVIASVTFKKGELPDSPIEKTSGHLLVVSGFTSKGDVIVYDPAAPTASLARRIYPRAAFNHAWLVNKRGLVYLIGPLKGMRASIGVPVADLMAAPVKYTRIKLDDPLHLSQLLYGEKITLLKVDGNWVEVLADEQLNFKNGHWRGYSGWIRAKDISFSKRTPSNSVIRTRQAILHRNSEIINLSVGTRLHQVSHHNGISTILLLDGTTAEIDSSALYAPTHDIALQSRTEIIRAAELFLGTSYYWGGRAGVQPDLSIGVDCSGLVSLAYRVVGLNIPRDSSEQKLKSLPIKRSQLKPADLIFLSDPKNPNHISHVMIYTGGDGFIESRKSSGRVLRSSFKERFGKYLSAIESGNTVTDYSYPKPKKRFIYFGSYWTK